VKAALLERLEQLTLREVPMPRAEPGGFVVHVGGCGICGSDLRTFYHGNHALALPQILGHEIAGEVTEVGDHLSGIQEGDRVTFLADIGCGVCRYCQQKRYNLCINPQSIGETLPGGFAEYVNVPTWLALNGGIVSVPDHVPFDLAALAEPLSCVLNGQDFVQPGPDDTVLVIGLGPIGCMQIIAAKVRGVDRLIAADISPERVRMARALGVDFCVNSGDEDLRRVVMDRTDGLGADVVIVACGVPAAQSQAVELAAKGGRISFFGGLPKSTSTVNIDSNRIHYGEIVIGGAHGARMQHLHEAMDLIASGRWPFYRLVTHRVSLDDVAHGFRLASERKSLRVVVTP
jgi:L-iditol 2-dehydrogenase